MANLLTSTARLLDQDRSVSRLKRALHRLLRFQRKWQETYPPASFGAGASGGSLIARSGGVR